MMNLINGDCTQEICRLNDKYNIIITSPTYDFSKNGKFLNSREYSQNQAEFLNLLGSCASENAQLFYVSRPKRRKHPLHDDKSIYQHPYEWLSTNRTWKIQQEIIWIRPYASSSSNSRFIVSEERIFWLSNGEARKIPSKIGDNEKTTVWPLQYSDEDKYAFSFPISLPHKILSIFGRSGDKILDPYMGAGTTGLAASRLGLDFCGIEIEKEIFNIAVKRLK